MENGELGIVICHSPRPPTLLLSETLRERERFQRTDSQSPAEGNPPLLAVSPRLPHPPTLHKTMWQDWNQIALYSISKQDAEKHTCWKIPNY
ncbi:MAG: hypothetical protein KME21_05285 [Desmonostoc vinosum HA7617-LM4]|nr:hypothetical protein [Desmonostoc vinosum HA7617-LM4]